MGWEFVRWNRKHVSKICYKCQACNCQELPWELGRLTGLFWTKSIRICGPFMAEGSRQRTSLFGSMHIQNSKGTHNADSIMESKVIYYLEQCEFGV